MLKKLSGRFMTNRLWMVMLFLLCDCLLVSAQPLISVGHNVQVSTANPNDPHDEVLMAADPVDAKRLLACVIVRQIDHMRTILYASFDGGVTWSPAHEHGDEIAADPTCAFGPDGKAYFASLLRDPFKEGKTQPVHPVASYSTDGGRTWKDSVIPGSDKLGVDRDYIIADTTYSKYRGRVYLYMQMHGEGLDGSPTPMGVTLWRSLDGGATFERPIQTFPPDNKTIFWLAGSAVLSDGTFAALLGQMDMPPTTGLRDKSSIGKKQGELKILTSSDGGDTFKPAVKINDMYGHWFDPDIARVAADTQSTYFKDRLYAVWSDGRTGGRKHILLSYSADKGKTWSTPRRVDDDDRPAYGELVRDAGMPAVAVNKDGVVGVSWYDRRDNTTNDLDYVVHFAASFDGGETFTPSVRVSEHGQIVGQSEKWMPRVDMVGTLETKANPFGVAFQVFRDEWSWGGHTAGLAADADGVFHPLWVDNHTGVHQVWTAPVTVAGSAIMNGSTDLAKLADVSGHCIMRLLEVTYDQNTREMAAKIEIENVSRQTITGPIKLRLTDLISPIGNVLVENADNHISGPGAVWDFSAEISPAGLAPDASTKSREIRLRFTSIYPGAFISESHQVSPDWLTFSGRVLAGGPRDEEKGASVAKEVKE